MGSGDYVLGTHGDELERLRFQHQLWRPLAQAAWRRAGLAAGQRVLDIGAGPGFAALELAQAVGPTGQVLALERSEAYLASAQTAADAAGLNQLRLHQHDLLAGPLAPAWIGPGFDLAWCRWVAMFLPRLEPLLELLSTALRPGGRVVVHEYVHWDSFALHPNGEAIGRFGQQVQRSFRDAGGDPDVSRRLPSLLAQRGLGIEALQPLPMVGLQGSMAARWMEQFVGVYSERLQQLNLWSPAEAAAVAAEIEAAHRDPGSYWVGPTVLELRARR